MDNTRHTVEPSLVPSEALKKVLVNDAGTVLVHLTEHLRQLRGDNSSLPDEFVQAWANFGDHLTDGSTGQFQAFADATNVCPPVLVVHLVRSSIHLGLIPKALADQLVTQLALQLNNLPAGEHHG